MPKKSTSLPLSLLAERTKGSVVGDPTFTVSTISSLDKPADGADQAITFIAEKSAAKINKTLRGCSHRAFFIHREAVDKVTAPEGVSLIAVDNPLLAVTLVVPLFFEPYPTGAGIHPRAEVDPSAVVASGVSIGAFAVIGAFVEIGEGAVIHPHVVLYPGVKIGARAVLHSNVTIREDCVIGADTIIQNGTVIGGDGFGYLPDPELGLRAVPQIGGVIIGDRVEIGANSCVDRAAFGSTTIGLGTKIDNQVQIGHNTQIGKFAIVCGQTGIAGSCSIADQVVLGGGVGVADHITIKSGIRVGGHAGVTSHLTEPGDYTGFPAIPAQQWRRQFASLGIITEILPKLRALLKSKE